MTCTVESCCSKARRSGMCPPHYDRWKRHGDPLAGRPHRRRNVETWERFQAGIDAFTPHPDGCWRWTGTIMGAGYGQVSVGGGRQVYAHRFSYEFYVGPIPNGLVIDHLCRNRACVNPAHLEVVTREENTRRGTTRARERSAA